MAIPKSLKEISESKALKIIAKHLKVGIGEWEGAPWFSDFVYEGRLTKNGYRKREMIRISDITSKNIYEHGTVSL